jgi:2-isopropylmalate synthase
MERQIKIFDTTLRDGEQSPGCSMNLHEKLEVAKGLQSLRVDCIEAGFPVASNGDFSAVKAIADAVRECTVAGLARALTKDIDAAAEALKGARHSRIHTFIATSDIHMKYKLKATEQEVLEQAEKMVRYAKRFCDEVQFSAEDASRSRPEFLYAVYERVIAAGATIINVPDTVGYSTPEVFYDLIHNIRCNVTNIHRAEIAVHCHNDLGLAVANTLAAAKAGASQLECTINGIGERAGNAALEEVVMALVTRRDYYQIGTRIDTRQLFPVSKTVSRVTGALVQSNKAIVGENAFAHESGIHQHGVLAHKDTYEIMTPESVGVAQNRLVLGKHSGRHAMEDRLKAMGYNLDAKELDNVFEAFKALADKKKNIDDRDIEALVTDRHAEVEEIYKLGTFVINSGNQMIATASVQLIKEGQVYDAVAKGHGPVDAAYKAIELIVRAIFELEDYSLKSVTEGEDALGEARVKLRLGPEVWTGTGVSTDVIEASIKAYLNAINRMLEHQSIGEAREAV